MTRRKWSVLAVSAAAAASVICAGATALAAAGHGSGSHATHSNYRGPARTASAVPIRHDSNYRDTNYQGPARGPATAVVHGSNRPGSARPHARTPGGNR
jgi:hypothetical protein